MFHINFHERVPHRLSGIDLLLLLLKMIYTVVFLTTLVFLVVALQISRNKNYPFPRSLLINLDRREDRKKYIFSTFHNWPTKILRVSAIEPPVGKPGWVGCAYSHIQCVKIAHREKLPWVIIMEDDCAINEGGITRLYLSILPYLWRHKDEWDIFNGGFNCLHTTTQIPKVISRNIGLIEAFGYGLNFYIVNSRAYDRILNDSSLIEPTEPIDVYYSKKYKTWVSIPFITRQIVSFSDIENCVKDYSKNTKRSELFLESFFD